MAKGVYNIKKEGSKMAAGVYNIKKMMDAIWRHTCIKLRKGWIEDGGRLV